MLKLIVISSVSCLALVVSAQAAKPEGSKEKAAPKPKASQKQQAAPKQHAAPKTQVQAPAKIERSSRTTRSDVPKKQERTLPAVQSNKPPTVKAKEIQTDRKQLETRTSDVQPKKSALVKQTVQKIQSEF